MRIPAVIVAVMLWIVAASPASATIVSIDYQNGTVHATAGLNIVAGQAVSGAGTISGGGLIGTLPMTLLGPGIAAAPLTAPAASDCVPGATGCYDVGVFSCGCSFVGQDTVFNVGAVIPVDTGGIAFQVGGTALNYGFALYDAGDGTVGEILVGAAAPQPSILIDGVAAGTLKTTVVSEPTNVAFPIIGLVTIMTIRRFSSFWKRKKMGTDALAGR